MRKIFVTIEFEKLNNKENAMKFTVSHKEKSKFEAGLRGFFQYRDLGIDGATNGNYGAIFGGFATNPHNGSIHVHFEAQQRNQNPCDSGSSSWTWNGTTFSSDNPTTLILNQLGEVIGGQDVGFPFDELDDLVAWGPVLNETYVGFCL